MSNHRDSTIRYFPEESGQNLTATLEVVADRWRDSSPRLAIISFSSGGTSMLELRERLGSEARLIVVTYPHKHPFRNEDGDVFYAPTSESSTIERLQKTSISVVKGTRPFEDIIHPRASSVKHLAIRETLKMISGGMELCCEAVMMACAAGEVEQGDEVISFSADTAIVGVAALPSMMFHPGFGFEVREILCKPRVLTETRPRDTWKKMTEGDETL